MINLPCPIASTIFGILLKMEFDFGWKNQEVTLSSSPSPPNHLRKHKHSTCPIPCGPGGGPSVTVSLATATSPVKSLKFLHCVVSQYQDCIRNATAVATCTVMSDCKPSNNNNNNISSLDRSSISTSSIESDSEPIIMSPGACSSSSKTKVHFADDEDEDAHIAEVIEFEDDTDSKKNREVYWEIFARDRARFKDRIEQYSETLNRVLEPQHREKVYKRLKDSEQH